MGGLTQTEVYVSMGNLNGDLNLLGPATFWVRNIPYAQWTQTLL